MNFSTINEIYIANDETRKRLIKLVSDLSREQANLSETDGGWTIANIVEHLSKVESGMTRISAKLLSKAEAENKTAEGSANVSENFINKVIESQKKKFQAPEVVSPQSTQTISQSLVILEENRKNLNNLREKFENFDGTIGTFPHPAFGDLNAHEWLALIGLHEVRHMTQIERILSN